MKTITQYRPLIFNALLVGPARRLSRRERLLRRWAVGFLLGYVGLSWAIAADTGLAVWHWQFWLIFGPLFMLGEQILGQIARVMRREVPRPLVEVQRRTLAEFTPLLAVRV